MVLPNGSQTAQPGQVTPPATPAAAQFGTTPAPSTPAVTQADLDKAVHAAKSTQGRELAEKYRLKELASVTAGGDETARTAVLARQEQERLSEQNETVLFEAQADREAAKAERAETVAMLAGIKADALVAANPGIDKAQLLAMSKGDVTVMEQLAPMMPKANPNAPPPAATPAVPGQPVTLASVLQPDNNVSAGAGGLSADNLTPQAIKGLAPTQLQEALDVATAKAKTQPIATSKLP